tara:strand:+ start:1920 stop:3836 length:1917 start_codon:yes stop_codon:yes gene_type:complete
MFVNAQFGSETFLSFNDDLKTYTIIDFDNDGDMDIASFSQTGTIHVNDGSGEFDSSIVFPTGYFISNVNHSTQSFNIDFDGDGWEDIIVRSDDDILLYTNDTLGGFIFSTVLFSLPFNHLSISLSDIDQDGDVDILERGVFINDGNGGFSSSTPLNNLSGLDFPYDIDNDGDDDVITIDNYYFPGHYQFYYTENLGLLNFATPVLIATTTENELLGLAIPLELNFNDINNDGNTDILFLTNNQNNTNIHLLTGSGNGSFTQSIIDSVPVVYLQYSHGINDLVSVDVDEDGDVDVVILEERAEKISYFENDGVGGFSSINTVFSTNNAYLRSWGLSAGDIDQDGDQDLLWRHISSSSSYPNRIGILDNITHCVGLPSYNVVDNGSGNYTFTNTSLGTASFTHWAFGDGTTSLLSSPNHTFTTNGIFEVVLTIGDSSVINGGDCFDYVVDTISVIGVPSPLQCHSGFVMYPDTGNNDVLIINSSTGSNLTYLWEFGDGNTSILQNPSHTYATAGPFYLCLTVDDGAGCVDQYCDSIGANGVVFKTGGFTINVIGTPIITGVENIDVNGELMIFPNPTSTQLTITTDMEVQRISITNVTGKQIRSFPPNSNTFNVEDLSDGIYFIRIEGEDQSVIRKFIKN